jgi:ABC-type polysaccharide/polyol phosphate export permease
MNSLAARLAIQDIMRSFRQMDMAVFLAWEDIRQRYVRTMLGPIWIVLSTGIWFSAMGFVMANLFHQKIEDYLPFVMSGLLIWNLISISISEGSQVLVTSASLITSFPIPIFTHYIRFIMRNYIIFMHNVIILLIVFMLFPPQVTVFTWLIIPGLLIDLVILLSAAVFLSLANLRYRDTNLAVASAMQVLQYVTPIFWDRGMLEKHRWIADVNPFYHMLEIVRGPMLGQAPHLISWEITLGMAVCMFVCACFLFTRYRHRIIYWL